MRAESQSRKIIATDRHILQTRRTINNDQSVTTEQICGGCNEKWPCRGLLLHLLSDKQLQVDELRDRVARLAQRPNVVVAQVQEVLQATRERSEREKQLEQRNTMLQARLRRALDRRNPLRTLYSDAPTDEQKINHVKEVVIEAAIDWSQNEAEATHALQQAVTEYLALALPGAGIPSA